MSDWRTNPLTILACMVVIAISCVVVLRSCAGHGGPPPGPAMAYACESCGTTWEQPRAIGAECPNCSESGHNPVEVGCRGCKHTFVGWNARHVGPGKFEYQHTRGSEWLGVMPDKLTCPQCRKTGEFSESGLFVPKAMLGRPGAAEASDDVLN